MTGLEVSQQDQFDLKLWIECNLKISQQHAPQLALVPTQSPQLTPLLSFQADIQASTHFSTDLTKIKFLCFLDTLFITTETELMESLQFPMELTQQEWFRGPFLLESMSFQ